MLIEEQIKIARMIASGTPREVAINEVAPTSSIEKSGQTIDVDAETVQDRAKSKLDKVRQAARIARKKTQRGISKGGAIVRSAAGKLAKKDDKPKPTPTPKPETETFVASCCPQLLWFQGKTPHVFESTVFAWPPIPE